MCRIFGIFWLICMPLAAVAVPIDMSDEQQAYVEDIMRIAKAGEMLNYMDENIDPCDNFYSFACGNFNKVNPTNAEHSTTGLFERLQKGLEQKLLKVLNNASDPTDTPTERTVKRYYRSCNRIGDLMSIYQSKLEAIISEFGEMPVLSADGAWLSSEFDWVDVIGRIAYKYNVQSIISIEISPDFVNNKQVRVYIGQPSLPLNSQSMYLDNHTAAYRDYSRQKIAKTLITYLDVAPELAQTTAKEIFDFEVALARGMFDTNREFDMHELATLTTLEDMQARYAPTVDVARLVNLALGEQISEPVYEIGGQYMEQLMSVIRTTPKRNIANYIYYYLIQNFIEEPKKTTAEQAKACIGITKQVFAKVLDNMIYRRYSNKNVENDVHMIWREMKATLKATLESDSLHWMRQATRLHALEKLAAMQLQINAYEQDNFTEEFGALTLTEHDLVQNQRNIAELLARRERAKYHQSVKTIEAGEILSITPANIVSENMIKVPVAVLQPNYLWADSYPKALQFGTLGALIGHEIIHGFDNFGRTFDKHGNKRNWWDPHSTLAFKTKTQCFADQYSRYIYNGRHLPRVTQAENIADNGGVRLGYAAYLRWHEHAPSTIGQQLRRETLPLMSYTSKQLFFISYAQVWCRNIRRDLRDLYLSTDTHAPSEYRLIGSLSNFPEFAIEFNCAMGKPMNPSKKCEIY